jgi:hypothetical protein
MISIVGYGEPAGAISVPGASPGDVGFLMRVLRRLLARDTSVQISVNQSLVEWVYPVA